MKKNKELVYAINRYIEKTGCTELDMDEVAKFAKEELGFDLPPPTDPLKKLAQQLARAAREETKVDPETGQPHSAYIAARWTDEEGQSHFLWSPIEEAKRDHMLKMGYMRRGRMASEMAQWVNDKDYWQKTHPTEAPLPVVTDLTPDVNEIRAIDGLPPINSNGHVESPSFEESFLDEQ